MDSLSLSLPLLTDRLEVEEFGPDVELEEATGVAGLGVVSDTAPRQKSVIKGLYL